MNLFSGLRQRFFPAKQQTVVDYSTRAHPQQRLDHAHYLYAPSPNLLPYMAQYAVNVWVYTAVSTMAELCASAELEIVDRKTRREKRDDHGLLDLLGPYGKPNDAQDSFEFWTNHYTNLKIAGNCYWYWRGAYGQPDEVHLLDPACVRIEPAADQTVGAYCYTAFGREIRLSPAEVTHFKTENPFNRYYGLSALQILMSEVVLDNSMVHWNTEFLRGEDVAVPAGILIVDNGVNDKELARLQDEFTATHAQGRRTAIVRAQPGSAVWNDAGVKPRDVDFSVGRMLSRQAVYEAMKLPLGVMSEASTEAHANVSQRQLYTAVKSLHRRTTAKINSDAIGFWPAWRSSCAQFEDIAKEAANWKYEALRLNTAAKFLTTNEIRKEEYRVGPIEGGDSIGGGSAIQAKAGGARELSIAGGSKRPVGGESGAPRATASKQGRTGSPDENDAAASGD